VTVGKLLLVLRLILVIVGKQYSKNYYYLFAA